MEETRTLPKALLITKLSTTRRQVENRPVADCAPFGGSELRDGANLRRPKWATRQGGNNASSVTGSANANLF